MLHFGSGILADPNATCTTGDVRLRGGARDNEGRVEICYDNHWGALCDNSWDNNDAAVVCRQLGYSTDGKCQNRIERCTDGCVGVFGRERERKRKAGREITNEVVYEATELSTSQHVYIALCDHQVVSESCICCDMILNIIVVTHFPVSPQV